MEKTHTRNGSEVETPTSTKSNKGKRKLILRKNKRISHWARNNIPKEEPDKTRRMPRKIPTARKY